MSKLTFERQLSLDVTLEDLDSFADTDTPITAEDRLVFYRYLKGLNNREEFDYISSNIRLRNERFYTRNLDIIKEVDLWLKERDMQNINSFNQMKLDQASNKRREEDGVLIMKIGFAVDEETKNDD